MDSTHPQKGENDHAITKNGNNNIKHNQNENNPQNGGYNLFENYILNNAFNPYDTYNFTGDEMILYDIVSKRHAHNEANDLAAGRNISIFRQRSEEKHDDEPNKYSAFKSCDFRESVYNNEERIDNSEKSVVLKNMSINDQTIYNNKKEIRDDFYKRVLKGEERFTKKTELREILKQIEVSDKSDNLRQSSYQNIPKAEGQSIEDDNTRSILAGNESTDKHNFSKHSIRLLEENNNDAQNAKKDGVSQTSMYENVSNEQNVANNSDTTKELLANMPKVTADEIVYKFVGAVFRSFRDKPARNVWRRRSLGHWDAELKPETELSRSQYSLVSCNDLTAGAVQLWMGLPEEVKYDPALAPFRQFYEKEHGKLDNRRNGSTPLKQRLPSVNSAPHLNNNHVVRDEPCDNAAKPIKNEKLLEDHDTTSIVPRKSTVQKAGHYVKMILLLACWVFFTAAFLMYNEKETITRNSSVAPHVVKSFVIASSEDSFTMLLKLSGPFLSDTGELKLNSSYAAVAKKMEVWVERTQEGKGVVQASDTWKLILQNETDLDFSEGELRSTTLRMKPYDGTGSNLTSILTLRIRTTANQTTPFAMSYTLDPLDVNTGVIYACALLLVLYVLIIFEIINRTMAAVLVSTSALATLAIIGERPTLPEIISWLDVETLLLLFSMMLLVAIMAETGMFDFLAVFTFEVTKGKLWPLISVLCTITAVLSTFLDNVTTVLLMTPVTIRLCEVMDLDPIPILMSMVLYSNIGGTATPVGDPPNVIIASNKAVVQAGINFTNFTLHMTFGILLVCVQTYFQLRFIYRDTNKLRLNEPRDIKDLRHQISIWRRAAESLPHLSRDEHVVRERLERKVKKLTAQLNTLVRESKKRACPKDTFKSTLADMKEKYKIRDKALLIKSSIAIGFVVIVFFLHSIPELKRISLGWTAFLGAILLLTLADREDLEPILHRVEWSTLLFFAALFVLMEALSKLGLIEFIGGITESLILAVDENARLAVAILLMLWVSGVTSAFVDNIPLTTMMVRVVTSLGSNPTLNLPMSPLIWALSFGACLGGNGTLIGASANVVCAGVAEQHGYKFSFVQFFKIGFPMMIGHLIVASGYLMFCHCLFTWH